MTTNKKPLTLDEIENRLNSQLDKQPIDPNKIIPRIKFGMNTLLYRVYGYMFFILYRFSTASYANAWGNIIHTVTINEMNRQKKKNYRTILPLQDFFTADQIEFIKRQAKKCEEQYRLRRDKHIFIKLFEKYKGNALLDLGMFLYDCARESLCRQPDKFTDFYPIEEQLEKINKLFCNIGNRTKRINDKLASGVVKKFEKVGWIPETVEENIQQYIGPKLVLDVKNKPIPEHLLPVKSEVSDINIDAPFTEVDGGKRRRKSRRNRKSKRKSKKRGTKRR